MPLRRKKTNPRKAGQVDRRLGENLRSVRMLAGISLETAAGELGITYQQIQKYENGISRVSVGTLIGLRRFYNVPYDTLLDGLDTTGLPHNKPIMPPDRLSANIARKIIALEDFSVKQKINRIIDILIA